MGIRNIVSTTLRAVKLSGFDNRVKLSSFWCSQMNVQQKPELGAAN